MFLKWNSQIFFLFIWLKIRYLCRLQKQDLSWNVYVDFFPIHPALSLSNIKIAAFNFRNFFVFKFFPASKHTILCYNRNSNIF